MGVSGRRLKSINDRPEPSNRFAHRSRRRASGSTTTGSPGGNELVQTVPLLLGGQEKATQRGREESEEVVSYAGDNK